MSAAPLLRRIAGRISEAASLASLLTDVVEFVTSLVGCDSCCLYVLHNQELLLHASKNPHPKAVGRLNLKSGRGIVGWIAELKKPAVITQGAGADPRFRLFHEMPEDRFESFLSVPLVSFGKLVGVINLQNREAYDYGDRAIELVSTIGLLLGSKIEIASLEQRNSELCERLESRTIVERAKGLLQRRLGISESEAYQKLQRQSQDMRRPMREIAEAIVLSHAITNHS